MGGLAKFLVVMGVGSIILNMFGFEFKLLMWIDLWGPGIGWAIRIGMIVVGAVLWVLSARTAKPAASA